MQILRDLMDRQHEHGWLDDATLRDVAAAHNVPLYRIEGLVSFYPHFRRSPPPSGMVQVCRDVACRMAGGPSACERLKHALADRMDVEVHPVSCLGQCDSAPAVAVNEQPLEGNSLRDVDAVLEALDQLPSVANAFAAPVGCFSCDPYQSEQERYGTVRRLVAEHRGDRMAWLHACTQPLQSAGLRGMGGAGFPTGRKWEMVGRESSDTKFVICNADESEPGTFKDRVILEQLPQQVVEGMLLAGLAIGARRGIVYLRHEYVTPRACLQRAIDSARKQGLLGPNAAGSGWDFDIEIFISPGGYILGEETALLQALEDQRGEPRNKPPYPGQYGLWGQPTLINNVETFTLATAIIHHGADWWAAQGVDGYRGLKFVCISGDVVDPGVYEVPMGTRLSDLIDLAGGMRDDLPLQAFLPGGASTGFLPADKADTPLDFDALKQAGSALGTGALVVFNNQRDLFDLAINLIEFFRNESCGKCVPCRVGSQRAVELLQAVQSGKTAEEQLSLLPVLGETLEQTSICGLGQVALSPILSLRKNLPR